MPDTDFENVDRRKDETDAAKQAASKPAEGSADVGDGETEAIELTERQNAPETVLPNGGAQEPKKESRGLAVKKQTVKEKLILLFQVCFGIIIGLLLSVMVFSRVIDDPKKLWEIPVILVIVPLFFAVQMTIHAACARYIAERYGYQTSYFRVFFFEWIADREGKLQYRFSLPGVFGALFIFRPKETESSPDSLRRILLAGAVGNLGSMILGCFPIWIFGWKESAVPWISLIWIGTALFDLISEMLPRFSGEFPTDGLLYRYLDSDLTMLSRLLWNRYLCGQLYAGVRPRHLVVFRTMDEEEKNYEQEFLQEPENEPCRKPMRWELQRLWYRYLRETDDGNQAEANLILFLMRRMLPYYHGDMRGRIYYELCFRACLDGNTAQASYYYEKSQPILRRDRSMTGFRIRAYYAFYVKKDIRRACELAREGQDVKNGKNPFAGLDTMERDLLSSLEGICLDSPVMRSAVAFIRR